MTQLRLCAGARSSNATVAGLVCAVHTENLNESCRYRPQIPQIVATTNKTLASGANLYFGMFSVLLPNGKLAVKEALKLVLEAAKEKGCYMSGDVGILHGSGTLFADQDGVVSIVKV